MEDTRDDAGPAEQGPPNASWWPSDFMERFGSVSLGSQEETLSNTDSPRSLDQDVFSSQKASQVLWQTGMLFEPIPNGFYSLIPENRLKEGFDDIPTLDELHALEAEGLKADIILVDTAKDKKLSMLKQLIAALVKGLNSNPAAMIKKIAGLVSDFYKRPNSESPAKAALEETSHMFENRGVQLLGQIRNGSCRPRAILFKVLADTVGLESRLMVGLPNDGTVECVDSYKHLSVIVVLNSVEMLVDLMRFPGQLIPRSTKAIFMTHISAAGESDSAENDSCDSPLEPNSPLYGFSERVDPDSAEKDESLQFRGRFDVSSNVAGPSLRNMMLRPTTAIDRKLSLSHSEPNIATTFWRRSRRKAILSCTICMQLPERPVTTPCGHNFCLKCFEKCVAQGNRNCANCRQRIPVSLRINSALVAAIRLAKISKRSSAAGEHQPRVVHYIQNQNRPDKAFTTERAKKPGNANASSGRIFVTTAHDHFGPITAENDPERNQGVMVGETWRFRMECRQWGIHRSVVAGIFGQSKVGSQSVVLSGGYVDDEDHGEWFIYTGSGGRDLSGNKRTNKQQSKDQEFTNHNEALRLSCRKGYPVRVVRSHKEKRSSYAPTEGVLRYDGVYRIEKCWRKKGTQGFKVCRYLFVRCDNEPAPWTSDDHGDRPRPLPVIKELKIAIDITERKGSPSWDYDEEKDCWMWKRPPPISKQPVEDSEDLEDGRKMRRVNQRTQNVKEKVLKEFSCHICQKVLNSPVTTPCAHNFCKACLEGAFAGISFIKERTCEGRRTLRSQKNVMKCPLCSNDIAEFLQNLKVNTELKKAIEKLQQKEEDFEEEEEEEEEEAEEEEEIDYAGEETLDETKESISSVPQTETTPQIACEQKKPARKRKKLNNAENVVDSGMMARKSKKIKVAAV